MNDGDAALLALGRALKAAGYRHVTVTPATHARVLSRPARQLATRLEDVFGWSLPFRAGLVPDALWRLSQAAGVVVADGENWRSTVRWSTLDDDLYVHSAYPTGQPTPSSSDRTLIGTQRHCIAISSGARRRCDALSTSVAARAQGPL